MAIVEGLPAGLKIDREGIDRDLTRRQQGYGRGARMEIEKDRVTVLSGIRFGETIGSPITLQIQNKDGKNWAEKMAPFGESAGERVTAPSSCWRSRLRANGEWRPSTGPAPAPHPGGSREQGPLRPEGRVRRAEAGER